MTFKLFVSKHLKYNFEMPLDKVKSLGGKSSSHKRRATSDSSLINTDRAHDTFMTLVLGDQWAPSFMG